MRGDMSSFSIGVTPNANPNNSASSTTMATSLVRNPAMSSASAQRRRLALMISAGVGGVSSALALPLRLCLGLAVPPEASPARGGVAAFWR